jgi:glycine cleavage system H protein
MTANPQELYYTASHEWVRKDSDNTITVGITHHAQDLLGDIVFVDVPSPDEQINQGDETAVIESVKTAADIYAPLTGKVTEVNQALAQTPELINTDPYGEGWIYRLEISDANLLQALLTAEDYSATISES